MYLSETCSSLFSQMFSFRYLGGMTRQGVPVMVGKGTVPAGSMDHTQPEQPTALGLSAAPGSSVKDN